MKSLLTLSTLTALSLCLHAEENKKPANNVVTKGKEDFAIVGNTIDSILKNPSRAPGSNCDDSKTTIGNGSKRTPLDFTGPVIPGVSPADLDANVLVGNPAAASAGKGRVNPGMLDGRNIKGITPMEVRVIAIDPAQPGWKALTKEDFTKVNSADDTWEWKKDMLSCTGKPVSVMRTVKEYKNFEMVVEWRHNKPAGNSGVFVWATPASIEKLTKAGKPGLPAGIEVQVLDNGYTDKVAKKGGKTDWFTTHGDVFPVRVKMKPIGKTSPNGSRSFPRKDLSKDHGNWNHYYIRGINGEVRLWVNGQEVSGGSDCDPAQGYLCLESEGSPIDFRNLYVRELP